MRVRVGAEAECDLAGASSCAVDMVGVLSRPKVMSSEGSKSLQFCKRCPGTSTVRPALGAVHEAFVNSWKFVWTRTGRDYNSTGFIQHSLIGRNRCALPYS